MKVTEAGLPGLLLIEPAILTDTRGYFLETFRAERYAGIGVTGTFEQDNLSFSRRGVLRGLHFQHPNDQAKLVYALRGEVFDAAVDVRRGSPTYGRWSGVRLSARDRRQLFIPEGFAHGFCVLSEEALFAYKCSRGYDPATETTVLWNDPAIGIEWPVAQPLLSPKDAAAPRLADVAAERLPAYTGRSA